MNRLVVCMLFAFLSAATLRPTVIHADDEVTAGEAPQPVIIPQLASPVPISFEANRLINVMDYLENTTGFPIDVDWPELEKWNVSKDVEITLGLTNVPSGRAIELVMHEAAGSRLTLLLDGGERLHVTMGRKAVRLLEADPERWTMWRATSPPSDGDQPTLYEAAEASMDGPIPWSFEEDRAANIFHYLRNVAEVSLYADWNSLRKVGIDEDSRITGTGDPKPASDVLDTVLTSLGDDLAWHTDDFGVVIISTRDVIDQMFPASHKSGDTEAGSGE